MKKILCMTFLTAVVVGCVTPMSQSDIDELTTCKNTNLKAIRKNLLLNGYKILNATDEDLSTDFKQVSGYSTSRTLQAINVIKIDDKTFRFKVRKREDRVETVDTGSTSFSQGMGNQSQSVNIQQKQAVNTSNENDERYYIEYRETYAKTHRDVCGN